MPHGGKVPHGGKTGGKTGGKVPAGGKGGKGLVSSCPPPTLSDLATAALLRPEPALLIVRSRSTHMRMHVPRLA